MAFIALRILIFCHLSSYYCLSQNTEELLFVSVREAIGEIKAIGQKVTEMENTMSSKFEEMENTISSKFEEMENKFEGLEGRMDIMQGQLAEVQGSSKGEGILQICVDLMEMERELQSNTLNTTCNTWDQIANLQESFSTELERIEHSMSSKVSNLQELLATDECATADSNDCSPNASCQDKMILYQCECLSGYTGDGITCEEMDECSSTGENSCHRLAACNNFPGGYTCTCNRGFSGDGFSCEDVDECRSTGENSCHRLAVCNNIPGGYTCTCNFGSSGDGFNCEGCATGFTDVPGAGCLKAIEELTTFDDAITHCSTLSAQLVVPQNFQDLQDYVRSLPGIEYWIGIKQRRWSDGRDVAQEEWRPGQPDGDVTECGYIEKSSLGIRDVGCKANIRFICQPK